MDFRMVMSAARWSQLDSIQIGLKCRRGGVGGWEELIEDRVR